VAVVQMGIMIEITTVVLWHGKPAGTSKQPTCPDCYCYIVKKTDNNNFQARIVNPRVAIWGVHCYLYRRHSPVNSFTP
jgi:hypothetical protein